jgi:hypothetical protein
MDNARGVDHMPTVEQQQQLIRITSTAEEGTTQGVAGANKIGSMLNAHADFQAALREIDGTQSSVSHQP